MKKNTLKALLLTIALANTININGMFPVIKTIVETTKKALQPSGTSDSEKQKSAAGYRSSPLRVAVEYKREAPRIVHAGGKISWLEEILLLPIANDLINRSKMKEKK